MQKMEAENKVVDPAVAKRARRASELRAELATAQRQREVVQKSGHRDPGAEFRAADIAAWIQRIQAELSELENKGAK